jgi:hypothetical protein
MHPLPKEKTTHLKVIDIQGKAFPFYGNKPKKHAYWAFIFLENPTGGDVLPYYSYTNFINFKRILPKHRLQNS